MELEPTKRAVLIAAESTALRGGRRRSEGRVGGGIQVGKRRAG